jgi:hypothetical protein
MGDSSRPQFGDSIPIARIFLVNRYAPQFAQVVPERLLGRPIARRSPGRKPTGIASAEQLDLLQ